MHGGTLSDHMRLCLKPRKAPSALLTICSLQSGWDFFFSPFWTEGRVCDVFLLIFCKPGKRRNKAFQEVTGRRGCVSQHRLHPLMVSCWIAVSGLKATALVWIHSDESGFSDRHTHTKSKEIKNLSLESTLRGSLCRRLTLKRFRARACAGFMSAASQTLLVGCYIAAFIFQVLLVWKEKETDRGGGRKGGGRQRWR